MKRGDFVIVVLVMATFAVNDLWKWFAGNKEPVNFFLGSDFRLPADWLIKFSSEQVTNAIISILLVTAFWNRYKLRPALVVFMIAMVIDLWLFVWDFKVTARPYLKLCYIGAVFLWTFDRPTVDFVWLIITKAGSFLLRKLNYNKNYFSWQKSKYKQR